MGSAMPVTKATACGCSLSWAKKSTVKAGDRVRTDGGFTCLPEGATLIVQADPASAGFEALWIACEDGKHFLDGQLHDNGEDLAGLYAAD